MVSCGYSGSTRLLTVVSVVFLAAGMSQGAIGPALRDLADQAGTSTATAGTMLTAIFVAALASQSVAALIARRIGTRRIMLIGMVLFLVGISGIALAGSLPMLLAAAACNGFGIGTLLLVGNVIAAETSHEAGPLNLVNAMFGVGAIVSPALVSAALVATGTGIPALWVAPCAMAVGLVVLLGCRPDGHNTGSHERADISAVLGSALVWLVAGLALLEVSVEISFAVWLPTILTKATGTSLALGAMVTSLFWLLLTAARFVAAWASRDVAPLTMLRGAAMLCLTGVGLLVLACVLGSQVLALAAVILAAPALGPILPTALSLLRLAHPREAGAATGLAFGCCNIGAALTPPILGVVIARFGTSAGVAVLVAVATLMNLCLSALANIVQSLPSSPSPSRRGGLGGQSSRPSRG